MGLRRLILGRARLVTNSIDEFSDKGLFIFVYYQL